MRLLNAMEAAGMPWNDSLSLLMHSPDPDIRRAAAQHLAQSTIAPVLKWEILRDLMSTNNPAMIIDAVRTVGKLRLEGAVATLAGLLKAGKNAPPAAVQREVCFALGHIGTPTVMPVLVDFVKQSGGRGGDVAVRSAALWAVGMLPGPEPEEILTRASQDGNPLIRGAAKLALETRAHRPADMSAQDDRISWLLGQAI